MTSRETTSVKSDWDAVWVITTEQTGSFFFLCIHHALTCQWNGLYKYTYFVKLCENTIKIICVSNLNCQVKSDKSFMLDWFKKKGHMLAACKKYITVNYPQTFNILLLTTQIQNSKHKNFFSFVRRVCRAEISKRPEQVGRAKRWVVHDGVSGVMHY